MKYYEIFPPPVFHHGIFALAYERAITENSLE